MSASVRCVEWEKYPDKKAVAKAILQTHKFTPIPGQYCPVLHRSSSSLSVSHLTMTYTFPKRRVPVCSPPEHESRVDRISLEGVPQGSRSRFYRRFQLGDGAKGKTGSHSSVGESPPSSHHHSTHPYPVQDFPYNGETRREQLLQGKVTDNKHHLYVLVFVDLDA